MRENAEHISTNAGNVEHQREHFALLSRDINDLTDNFGTAGLKLYLDFCPMYNKQNGAIWVSEKKEIVNPYYGSKMSDCGCVKKRYNYDEVNQKNILCRNYSFVISSIFSACPEYQ